MWTTAQKRALVYEQLRQDILSSCLSAARRVSGRAEHPTAGEVDYYKVLGEYVRGEEALSALDEVLYDTCEGLVHSILVMLDGGAQVNEYLWLRLVDAKTKQNLGPRDDEYHGEFIEYLLDKGKAPLDGKEFERLIR